MEVAMSEQFTRPQQERRAPDQVTQAELKRYVKQVAVCREHQRLSYDLRHRFEKGASVEDGELSLAILVEYDRAWSLDRIAEVIGRKQAKELWKSIELSPVRRLRIKDNNGNIVGWQTRRTVSHVEEVSPIVEGDDAERPNRQEVSDAQ